MLTLIPGIQPLPPTAQSGPAAEAGEAPLHSSDLPLWQEV